MGELKRALSEKVNWKATKRSVSMLKKNINLNGELTEFDRTVNCNVNISEGAVKCKRVDAKSKPQGRREV
jgi:hypothetical protein